MHSLLKRQLRKQFGNKPLDIPGWESFLQQVNDAYREFDVDRNMLERALEISSQELLETNSQLRAVLEAFPDVFLLLDSQGIIIELKSGSSTELYMSPEQLLGQHIEVIHPDTINSPFAMAVEQVQQSGKLITFEYPVTLNQHELYFEARLLPVSGDHVFAIIRNVTERRIMEDQLRYLSMHDALTGLYNRAYFKLETAHLKKQSHRWIGLIVGDVDGLKLVNDTLGHEAGDDLLIKAAHTIRDSLRECDFVARIGGDEFAAILYNCNHQGIEGVISRIRNNITLINSRNPTLPLSLSLGYAVKKDASTSIDELFKEADDNMYKEKLDHRKNVNNNLVSTLIKSMDKRDFFNQGHVEHMQKLVCMMAEALGMSPNQISHMKLLAQFHDIGKVGISDAVIFKKGLLNSQERLQIERHPEIGYRIARLSPELMPIADWILRHHEWWNGQGYPCALAGEDIPLECRILTLVDAYDAMTSDRPYRKAMSHEEAIEEIKSKAGTQFDPELVRLFLSEIETKFPSPGSKA
ncbi:MAG: diguanylate cyclase [Syntrophomonas sp.]|uniref:diguanylate cyclase domain-containing protein n=1 Tax=Syntrophomonas sp. TaxID=2053627 RepID=UPI00260CC149|nr:diguanylate cyclase [Syntrophomonas sp.]MDD4626137.1 diguanylate cyclase [Syntrophomonas sp.]